MSLAKQLSDEAVIRANAILTSFHDKIIEKIKTGKCKWHDKYRVFASITFSEAGVEIGSFEPMPKEKCGGLFGFGEYVVSYWFNLNKKDTKTLSDKFFEDGFTLVSCSHYFYVPEHDITVILDVIS